MNTQYLLIINLCFVMAVKDANALSLSYTIGNRWLGGYANANAGLKSSSSAKSVTVESDMKAGVNLLKKRLDIASANTKATIHQNGIVETQVYLMAGRRTVGSINRSFKMNEKVTTPGVVLALPATSAKLGVGPFSLSIKMDAACVAGLFVESGVFHNAIDPALPPSVSVKSGAFAEASASGSLDLDLLLVAAGVEGQIRIARHEITSDLRADLNSRQCWTDVDWTRHEPQGAVTAWAKLRLLFVSKTFRATLLEWGGGESSIPLLRRRAPDLRAAAPSPELVPIPRPPTNVLGLKAVRAAVVY